MKNHDDEAPWKSPGPGETAAGGFNTTHWSVVLLAGQEESSSASASALETLCRTYWYPLYAYARRRGHTPHDGQDLTQQFFATFLEKKYFGLASPDRGRFRSFLLASFKHFLTNQYHRSQAVKHGGGRTFISWDEVNPEARYQKEPACDNSPDKLFELTWVLTLLEKVMQELRQEYVSMGKGKLFESLEIFLSGEKTESTYAQIGATLQMGESAIKMSVSRLRQRYGELLRSEIAQTVIPPTTVEDELRHLLGALSR